MGRERSVRGPASSWLSARKPAASIQEVHTTAFKIGDLVRCISYDFLSLTHGKDYTVRNIGLLGGLEVLNDRGAPGIYSPKAFELVPCLGNILNSFGKGTKAMLVKMTFITDRKINLIKELRSLTGSGLKEAKDAVEAGIIFNLNYPFEVLRFAQVVKMMDDTYNEHGHRYEVTEYVPPPRRYDPVDNSALGWVNRT